jgi:4-diphosphocytidyl-2-C-methyl-D-erythritol kinase
MEFQRISFIFACFNLQQTTNTMVIFPNAKINIGLNVLSKRKDGFHNIETVMYPVVYNDLLEILEDKSASSKAKKTDKPVQYIFQHTGGKIPGKQDENICIRAFNLLDADYKLPPVSIYLHKLIPIGAGLGGGSSDGANVLKLLNDLFKLGIKTTELEFYAKQLGTDCPFFIQNKPVYANGRGDKFENINLDLSEYSIVLITPPIHVATTEAYAKVVPSEPGYSLKDLIKQPILNWKKKMHNDFETTILRKYPEIAAIKKDLYKKGAVYASMSGSGSTVYGIFNNKENFKGEFKGCRVHWASNIN